jgi:hypothetical protein
MKDRIRQAGGKQMVAARLLNQKPTKPADYQSAGEGNNRSWGQENQKSLAEHTRQPPATAGDDKYATFLSISMGYAVFSICLTKG